MLVLLLGTLGLAAIYAAYYYFVLCAKPKVFVQKGSFIEEITNHVNSLRSYYPNIFTPFGWMQAVFMDRLKKKQKGMTFTRELFSISDGGQSALDWCDSGRTFPETSPILILLHGLNGGSMENYIQSMCAEATKRGWRSACIIARGNAGLKLKTWRPYNAGFTLDFQEVTEELKRRYPKAKIVACGYSLGANVITKALGSVHRSVVVGGCAVSNPLDLRRSTEGMKETFLGRHIFSAIMLKGLKRMILKNKDMLSKSPYSSNIDFDAAKHIKDIAVFDDTLTCKIFGYETSREYYDACSSAPYLRTVKTPLLLVCSEDDEVTNTMPIDLVPKECKENPYVAAVVTRNGGHVGWLEVREPTKLSSYFTFQNSWSDRVTCDFLQECIDRSE